MSTIMTQWQCVLILCAVSVLGLVVESKVYERCELAKVLHQRYQLGLAEVAQWVCIAKHSSGFNTAAQAGSSAGGSHGLFQISDVYWCSPPGQGMGCDLPCHKLRDDDLSDDLACAKRIFYEHQRISGDGYTAWSAYQQYCKQNAVSFIEDCFPGNRKTFSHYSPARDYNSVNAIRDYSLKNPGRIYERCELARELFRTHKMPMQQIPTWVCIAEHESRLNTAAIGRSNADGSTDHGIFQISDLYWCSHDRFNGGGGKACGLPCSKLLDSNITDDVHCVQKIFTEHTALSGDGFTAWTVYKPHCQSQSYANIANCFKGVPQQQNKMESYDLEVASNQVPFTKKFNLYNGNPFLKSTPNLKDKARNISPSNNDVLKAPPYLTRISDVPPKAKVYTRCSLAQELFSKYNFPIKDIATWVCIAEHESQLSTAAIGLLNTDGSLDHGLFQINDRYWCDHTEQGGKACNLPCIKLLDDDIEDDVACIKTIFEEHTRLSGDGFNAWTVYKPHCQTQVIEYIKTCFDEKTSTNFETFQSSSTINVEIAEAKGKTYSKCELAQELYHEHRMPMEQIPKWVCIAQHESSFSTGAVGRLNTDGSADHGLFQISDLYWCSHEPHGGKACNIPCNKLLDSDITDDVKCIRAIHEEHTRISGDGFNAWTVYKPHCSNIKINHVKECFTEEKLREALVPDLPISINTLGPSHKPSTRTTSKGKVFEKCELAQELLIAHKIPIEQVATWVCIAQHESSLNTAAVGRLNADGSLDHGLFQISDLYWCSHEKYGGKACNIPCDKLLDSDITDDIECIKVIYEEHTRISGDGFNAWTVYAPYCHGRKLEEIENCFSPNHIAEVSTEQIFLKKDKHIFLTQQDFGKLSYSHNPFLGRLKPSTSNKVKYYANNPFLQNVSVPSVSEERKSVAIGSSRIDKEKQQTYKHNPFLNEYFKQTASNPSNQQMGSFKPLPSPGKHHRFGTSTKANYENNPFLNGQFSSNTINKLPIKPCAKPNQINQFKNNPFLSHIKLVSNDMLRQSSFQQKSSVFIASKDRTEINKTYVNTHDFRPSTTTAKPKTVPSVPITPQPNTPIITLTTTTPKPATTKTTISNWRSKKPTAEPQNANTSWNWQNQRFFNATTTTRLPKTLTTRQQQNYGLTTTKPSTAIIAKSILKQNSIESTTPKYQTSTKHLKTTTEGWGKSNNTTSAKPQIIHQKSSTTKPPPTTENWRKWNNTTSKNSKATRQKSSTIKPQTTAEYPTKWNKTTAKYFNTTTTKLLTTTDNWRKWDRTTTYKHKSTTTKSPTTTENWRKWDKTSTTSSTNTTEKPIKWNKTTTSKYMLTTAKPLTTTENYIKWNRSTTKKFNASKLKSTTTKPQTLQDTPNWKKAETNTVRKPNTTTTEEIRWNTSNNKEFNTSKSESWTKSNRSTTNKPHTTSRHLQKSDTNLKTKQNPSLKPKIFTEDWRQWKRTTTKEPKVSTKNPETTTNNWRSVKQLTTRKALSSTESWRNWDTTQKTVATTTTTSKPSRSISISWKSESIANATKVKTTKPMRFDNYKNMTTELRYHNATQEPYFNKSSATNFPDASAEFAKFKNDPFSHPFFAKVNEQVKLLHGRFNTKITTVTPKKNQSSWESTLHQELKNSTFKKTIIV